MIHHMKQDARIYIREQNVIPDDLCLDFKSYTQILYQLVRNSRAKSDDIIINLLYVEVQTSREKNPRS